MTPGTHLNWCAATGDTTGGAAGDATGDAAGDEAGDSSADAVEDAIAVVSIAIVKATSLERRQVCHRTTRSGGAGFNRYHERQIYGANIILLGAFVNFANNAFT